MKTPQELLGAFRSIFNEACDAIAELMRSHNVNMLNLEKFEYEYDLALPAIVVFGEDLKLEDNGPIVGRPVKLYAYPEHIGIELDGYNGGGYLGMINENDINAIEAVELYDYVNAVFAVIDQGIPPFHLGFNEEED